jgi:uncharacterized Rmd1/YagE family protein
MEPTEAEKLKAHRTQRLLRWLVVVMIAVPVGIFLLQLFGRSH